MPKFFTQAHFWGFSLALAGFVCGLELHNVPRFTPVILIIKASQQSFI